MLRPSQPTRYKASGYRSPVQRQPGDEYTRSAGKHPLVRRPTHDRVYCLYLALRLNGFLAIMRLLSLNEHGDLTWRDFRQDEIPPYAILSHTWGTEEVSFLDLVDNSGKNKAGYRKIVFCGEQAARDNLRYF